ncbi:MAG: tetraacyldisaccharide 4'-kinase [Vicinamibacterales bacterium]
MYALYTAVILLVAVVASPWLFYQAVRHRKYVDSLGQRFGALPVSFNVDGEASIWIHAVSVGELLTARPLIEALRERHPALRLFVSTTTRAAQDLARKMPNIDGVFYFPFDLGFVVRRTLDLVRPKLFLTMETEIWPNLLRECRARGIRTAIVNGRLSSRSFPRYRLARGFFQQVLADVDRICAQSEESARRFVEIGAAADRVSVTGSLKFDSLEPAGAARKERVLRYLRFAPTRPVWVAGSTMKGEEAMVLRVFRRLKSAQPTAVLVLAPRHPERFAEAVTLAEQEGFRTVRRSDLPIDAEPRADVIVLDTIGELATVYQVGQVVFVGGSLVPTGGHNVLEPAIYGRPVVFGPHMQNFAEIAAAFVANDAGVQVASDAAFEDAILSLMNDPVRRAKPARRRARWSRPTAAPKRARSRCSTRCCRRPARCPPTCGRSGCRGRRPLLHTLYGRVALARRAWYERPGARRHLARPVISVGNLSVGGTGKTPLVAAIAAWLVSEGERPAILSRGYARTIAESAPTVVSNGREVRVDVARAGDEPLMLARAVPGAAVVVAADRHAAGILAEEALGATVHVLDDGFQHLALARDLDVVVTPAGAIATDAVLPKGRLREPVAALSRAGVLVVVGATDDEAQAEARHYGVPLGLAATRRLTAPIAVHGAEPAPGARVVAMAGIGQPAQFAEALRAAGYDVVDTCAFRDHHWYTAADLEDVARRARSAGATVVATTDKDAVRLEGLPWPTDVALARWPMTLDLPRFDTLTAAIRQAMRRPA